MKARSSMGRLMEKVNIKMKSYHTQENGKKIRDKEQGNNDQKGKWKDMWGCFQKINIMEKVN